MATISRKNSKAKSRHPTRLAHERRWTGAIACVRVVSGSFAESSMLRIFSTRLGSSWAIVYGGKNSMALHISMIISLLVHFPITQKPSEETKKLTAEIKEYIYDTMFSSNLQEFCESLDKVVQLPLAKRMPVLNEYVRLMTY